MSRRRSRHEMPPRWREEGAGGGANRFRLNPGALAARRHRNRHKPMVPGPGGGGAAVAAAVGAPRAAQVREALGRGARGPSSAEGPITPFMGPSKEGTRIFHFGRTSTNMSKYMRALNRPNPHERNGLTWI